MINNFLVIQSDLDKLEDINKTLPFRKVINHNWIIYSATEIIFSKIEGAEFAIIGDCLNQNLIKNKINISLLKGNFYLIYVHNDTIEIWSSLFNILPLYFDNNNKIISNSVNNIANLLTNKTINKTYILENLLFNYGFFNRTLYNEIQLVPANSYLDISGDKINIIKHTNIHEFFTRSFTKGDSVKSQMAELFIQTTNEYFPDNKFAITFTSGFDGRTLVSCAKKSNKNFSTCSFGLENNDDVRIPMNNAKELGIPYNYYNLHDQNYIQNEYLKHSNFLTTINPGCNSFIYPHFSYLAEEESKKNNYLLTGYFGSELFRALHLSGAVTSGVLVSLFKNKGMNSKEILINSFPAKVLNYESFKENFEILNEDIQKYFISIPIDLTPNQQFYYFVFEEILRKLFGSWINAQSYFTTVRTPFIDFEFIKQLLTTDLAGANNDFYTENPIKRYKGQILYAEIIRRTDSIVYNQLTGKGYKPSSLIKPFGFIEILYPFIKKRINRKVKNVFLDNLGIISGYKSNIKFLKDWNPYYFNIQILNQFLSEIDAYIPENKRDILLHSSSLNKLITDI